MSTYLFETYGLRSLDASAAADDRLQAQVRELLAGLYPAGPFERRRDQRYPLPKLIQLRPANAEGAAVGPAIVVSGKQICDSGLSFFHPTPIAYRLVLASLEKNDRTTAEFLLDIDWCRCTQLGWYESGGKFVRSSRGGTRG
jgi:hypothetical protein